MHNCEGTLPQITQSSHALCLENMQKVSGHFVHIKLLIDCLQTRAFVYQISIIKRLSVGDNSSSELLTPDILLVRHILFHIYYIKASKGASEGLTVELVKFPG